jgi:hypothetical protein
MMVVVTAANISDQKGARLIFERLAALPQRIQRLVRIWVDGTYEGVDFMKWTMDTYRWILQTVNAPMMLRGLSYSQSGGLWNGLGDGSTGRADYLRIMRFYQKHQKPSSTSP